MVAENEPPLESDWLSLEQAVLRLGPEAGSDLAQSQILRLWPGKMGFCPHGRGLRIFVFHRKIFVAAVVVYILHDTVWFSH